MKTTRLLTLATLVVACGDQGPPPSPQQEPAAAAPQPEGAEPTPAESEAPAVVEEGPSGELEGEPGQLGENVEADIRSAQKAVEAPPELEQLRQGEANQERAPTAPPTEANLAPDHLEQAEWDAMSDREKRAARAAAARNAYQREVPKDSGGFPEPGG